MAQASEHSYVREACHLTYLPRHRESTWDLRSSLLPTHMLCSQYVFSRVFFSGSPVERDDVAQRLRPDVALGKVALHQT